MKITKTNKQIQIDIEPGEEITMFEHKTRSYNTKEQEIEQIYIQVAKIVCIAFILILTGCSTLKNGYSESFRKTTLQRAIVITSSDPRKDRVYYEGYSIPSELKVNFWDWMQKRYYQKNDTVLITYSLYQRLVFEL